MMIKFKRNACAVLLLFICMLSFAQFPTFTPAPTGTPTIPPTAAPTATIAPTVQPTVTPTVGATTAPTQAPTPAPTGTQPPLPQSVYGNGGLPWAIPGTIEAENFDNGGEGVAYHDSDTSGPRDFAARDLEYVDLESDGGSGYNISYIESGEWMEYTVTIAAGSYYFDYTVAANDSAFTGSFNAMLSMTGNFASDAYLTTPAVSVPITGGWTTYQTVTQGPFTLNEGEQFLRIAMSHSAFNLNMIAFRDSVTPVPTADPTPGPTADPTPPGATPGQAILLEAEDYTGFSDTTSGNSGNVYRSDDVDLESCSEGGFNVGWVSIGEWLEYSLNVTEADTFDIYVRAAAPLTSATGGFNLYLDENQIASVGTIPMTSSWQSWADTMVPGIAITGGSHTLRIQLNGGFNFNYIYLASFTSPPEATPEPGTSLPASTQPPGFIAPVSQYGQLKVTGKSLCNSANTPIQLRGMCTHGIQWFPFVEGHTLPNLVYDWGVMIIRPAMYVEDYKNGDYWGGYVAHPDYMKAKVTSLVDEAISLGVYVIIDWHIHNEPNNFTAIATSFFTEMATLYGSYPNVIYEICNEPEYTAWDSVKNYANQVIPQIRAIDPDNIILVGTATWSQDVDVAADSPLTGYTNVMYSLHFYAGTHQQWLRDKANYALGKNLPVFVSEWGVSDSTGGSNGQVFLTEAQAWLDWMSSNKISWINWNFSNKGEASAALLPGVSLGGPWNASELSQSGTFIKSKM